ncbi:YbaB/EbfC family nucleoid-associated protein [Streptomyces sp. NPDC006622]|uniref:YbaB/EbfC family nucleoid-associated protein n=1 Tax=Streptomyces sp. NPDC006622 TaxID=3155459 RepID=UPI0033AEB419
MIVEQSWDDRVAEVMNHLKETEAAVSRAREDLQHASRTAASSDGSVRVTVGAQGNLADVAFLDGRYRSMTPAQVSAAVMDAFSRARAEAAQLVVATMDPILRRTPRGELPDGQPGTDWGQVFGTLLTDEPADDWPAEGARFRDELHEDEEDAVGADTPAAEARLGRIHGKDV